MKQTLSKVLSVPLPPELQKRVELAAAQRGVSRSEFIRSAVLDVLAEQDSKADRPPSARASP